MGSLVHVIERLEQAAQQCDQAVASFDEAFESATHAQAPQAPLLRPARGAKIRAADVSSPADVLDRAIKNAKKQFETIHREVLPVIDAIHAANKSVELTARLKAVRDLRWRHSPTAIKKRFVDQVLARKEYDEILVAAKNKSESTEKRVRQGLELMADKFGAWGSSRVRLTQLGDRLRYAAGYLRTTEALQPPEPTGDAVRERKNVVTIKVLFLGANPASTTRLALDKEVREITHKLRAATHGQQFEIVHEWAVQLSDLQAALLRHRPQIVHFSGHGEATGELLVENEAGAAVTIRPEALSNLFKILKKNIRCVVLNACYSEAQAEAIAQHIECVVGMTTAVGDTGAIAFAWSFYQALGFNSSVQEAFDLGCNQVDLAGLPDTDTPKLIARAGVRPEDVYLLDQDAAAGDGNPRDLAPAQQGVSSFTINVTGGTHGAIAVGPGAKAEGSVNVGDLGTGRGKPRS